LVTNLVTGLFGQPWYGFGNNSLSQKLYQERIVAAGIYGRFY